MMGTMGNGNPSFHLGCHARLESRYFNQLGYLCGVAIVWGTLGIKQRSN